MEQSDGKRDEPQTGVRTCAFARWGLIPSWAKDPAIGNRLVNARSETVLEKPSFRTAFRRRRCLIPVDAFYEWQKVGRAKQPSAICLAEKKPFVFAGLWERWQSPVGELIESVTVLTTNANELIRPIHDRMPVILPTTAFDPWLNRTEKVEDLLPLLRSYPSEEMTLFPVSSWVSNPRNEGERCLQPETALFA